MPLIRRGGNGARLGLAAVGAVPRYAVTKKPDAERSRRNSREDAEKV
jgi:hypothetical protein